MVPKVVDAFPVGRNEDELQSPGFSIRTDGLPIVEARLAGLWDLDTLDRFKLELDLVLRSSRAGDVTPERILLLIDARDHGVQPRAIVGGLQRLAEGLVGKISRTAVIVESALHTLQARRVREYRHHHVFSDAAEARAWLIDGSPD